MKNISLFSFLLLITACAYTPNTDFTVTVSNNQTFDRTEELVEVPISDIAKEVQLIDTEQYVILDAEGNQIPYQITFDDNLLFPATVQAKSKTTYTIAAGETIEMESYVYGRHYPERLDDIAWENDRVAYRAYGPALQARGERAFGYDVWVKRVPGLVVEQRYANELNPESQAEIARLRKEHKYEEANELYHSISYHVDHGNGLDCYKVGPTLGCGTTALIDGNNIVYPYCWKEFEIMENGPLRFTVKLTYNPIVVGKDSVIETRIISLEQGSQLNRTIITYEGLKQPTAIATGLVIHPENPKAYEIEENKGYIAYADLTDNIYNDNGIIYVGAVIPTKIKEAQATLFSDKEAKERGASGHVLAISTYKPESQYIYYWGSGWSKYGFDSIEAWGEYLDHYAQRVRNPLKVEY